MEHCAAQSDGEPLTARETSYLDNIFYQDRIGRMYNPIFAVVIVLVVAAAVLGAFATKLKSRDGLFSKPWRLEAKRQLLTERRQ
jgi:hypothetical protein